MKTDRVTAALIEILEDGTVEACERVEAARILYDLQLRVDTAEPEPEGATFTEEQFRALEDWIIAVARAHTHEGWARGWVTEHCDVRKAFHVEKNT